MVLRYILIIALLVYVLYKIGFFRGLTAGMNGSPDRKPPEGNVNVHQAGKKKPEFKGGEYIDYEEVK